MKNSKELKYLFVVIVIFIAACIETNIYLPALSDMMVFFSASEGAIQSLLTWNFIGICISGPFYGPLSDSFGRKKPLMVALGIFLIGSLVTLFATDLNQMLWGRILQGLGSGGCFTLGTAMIFDAFEKERAVTAISKINTIIPLFMAAAPMIGGYLNNAFGFRSNFLLICIFVILSFVVCSLFFEEPLAKEKRIPLQAKVIFSDFALAFKNLAFWQLTLIISLLFAGYIAFISGVSILFVVEFGMSKSIFPLIQGAIMSGWVTGGLLLKRFITKWGVPKVKKMSLLSCAIGGCGLVIATLIFPTNPYFLTSGMILYAFGSNWLIGLYFPEGMEILPNIKGIAASLITSTRLLVTAAIVGLASTLYNATIYPLAAVVLGTIVIILPTAIFYERRQASQSKEAA